MVDVALNPGDDNHEAPPPAEVGEEMRPARDALLHGEHPRALADEVTDGFGAGRRCAAPAGYNPVFPRRVCRLTFQV